MKQQILFSGENKKSINLTSAEFAHSVEKVKLRMDTLDIFSMFYKGDNFVDFLFASCTPSRKHGLL